MNLYDKLNKINEKYENEIKEFYLDMFSKLMFDNDELCNLVSMYINLIESGKNKEELIKIIDIDYDEMVNEADDDYTKLHDIFNEHSFVSYMPGKDYHERVILSFLAVNLADNIVKNQKKLKNTTLD